MCRPGRRRNDGSGVDLARHPRRCVLAYWHEPRFTSGTVHSSDPRLVPLARSLRRAGGCRPERARAQLRAFRAPEPEQAEDAQGHPGVRGRDGWDQPLRERAADQAQPSPKRHDLRCPQAEASPEVVPLDVRPRGRPKVPRLGNDALLTQAKDLPGRGCHKLTDDRGRTVAAHALLRARVRASAAALMRPAAPRALPLGLRMLFDARSSSASIACGRARVAAWSLALGGTAPGLVGA